MIGEFLATFDIKYLIDRSIKI